MEAEMRSFSIGSVLFALLLLSSEPATAAPWCADYGTGRAGGGTNCGFYSFQQCMDTVRGAGGFCRQNGFENPGWTRGRRYRRD
jgi:hypothetical protein